MRSTTPNAPLSDEELQSLDDFLLGEGVDTECLALEEAHGYLTALTVSRISPPAEAWLEAIWGSPCFANPTEQQRLTELMQRLRQDIAENLASGKRFEPFVIEEEDEDGEIYESYEGWCFGFMQAVTEHPEVWGRLSKPVHELLQPIAALALVDSDPESELDEEEYALCVELLPGSVAGLYRHFHG